MYICMYDRFITYTCLLMQTSYSSKHWFMWLLQTKWRSCTYCSAKEYTWSKLFWTWCILVHGGSVHLRKSHPHNIFMHVNFMCTKLISNLTTYPYNPRSTQQPSSILVLTTSSWDAFWYHGKGTGIACSCIWFYSVVALNNTGYSALFGWFIRQAHSTAASWGDTASVHFHIEGSLGFRVPLAQSAWLS